MRGGTIDGPPLCPMETPRPPYLPGPPRFRFRFRQGQASLLCPRKIARPPVVGHPWGRMVVLLLLYDERPLQPAAAIGGGGGFEVKWKDSPDVRFVLYGMELLLGKGWLV